MSVLFVHSGNLYGGVETVLLTLAREREAWPGNEPRFAVCFEGRLSEELRGEGARVEVLGGVRVSRPVGVWRARRTLGALLGGVGAVVCNSAWTLAIFGPAVRAAGLPLALWLHDAPDGTGWLERWARRTPPDLLVCNSRFTERAARRVYPRSAREVVYCPLSLDAPPAGARAAVRAELDTPESACVVVQASRMESWKGQTLHLEALGLLRDVPGWVCWMVGGGQRPREVEYLNGLKRLAAGVGIGDRVRFTGQRADVPRLLAAADIFCQPNTGPEPFGLALVEALAAGLPVVTTDSGGAREVVEESCGRRVAAGDARALARSLGELIGDAELRASLGGRGPSRARELCEPARQTAALAEAFGRLARGRRAA